MLILGALFVFTAGSYRLILRPAREQIGLYQANILKREGDLVWMRQAARRIQNDRNVKYYDKTLSPLSAIDRGAKQFNLNKAVNRLEPDDSGRIRIWLTGAIFDDMLAWVEDLHTGYGIDMISIRAASVQERPGIVNAQVTFLAPGTTMPPPREADRKQP